VDSFVKQYLYTDKHYYYFCLVSKNSGMCFKFSVLRRFLILIFKHTLLFNIFVFTQYVNSFVAALQNITYSSLFLFKRRLKFHGLAFGAEFDIFSRGLILNVGYASAPVFLVAPVIERIKLSTTKRKLSFESRVLEVASNFVSSVQKVRPVNVYFNPAKRGGRRGIRVYLSVVKRKKFNKDVK
jgi:hypothetical protein